ncbi:hypothetical protein [Halorientalis marina]|uniref:hypothetical protein n=1 Tax=Halorientalis marina TaxID=2931976 RepID=UPI001FF18B15|nr:hypothetical protein [Halorientalis marina]
MDEALEAVEVAQELGLEGVFAWLLRVIGLVALLVGAYLWLGAGLELLVVPAVLMVLGVVLLIAPSVLLALAELA